MLDAEEVAAMKRLHELGWGAKRISLLALRPAARILVAPQAFAPHADAETGERGETESEEAERDED